MNIATVFLPLSGRTFCWKPMFNALKNQTNNNFDVLLIDNSHCDKFSSLIKKSNFGEIIKDYSGIKGLADKDRVPNIHKVYFTLAEIYNKYVKMIETPYIWFIDDDTIPPLNAFELLLETIERFDMFSVSGAYQIHPLLIPNYYCAWEKSWRQSGWLKKGKGVQKVHGNGFGCALVRNYQDFNFDYNPNGTGFDEQFYQREGKKHRQAFINWDVICNHMKTDTTANCLKFL
jgi:hypothetical protein